MGPNYSSQALQTAVPTPSPTTTTTQYPTNPTRSISNSHLLIPSSSRNTVIANRRLSPIQASAGRKIIRLHRSQTTKWPIEYPSLRITRAQAKQNHFDILYGLAQLTPRLQESRNVTPVVQATLRTVATETPLPFDVFKTEADKIVEQVLVIDGRNRMASDALIEFEEIGELQRFVKRGRCVEVQKDT